jgi:ABC-type sugar transport system permease subunit
VLVVHVPAGGGRLVRKTAAIAAIVVGIAMAIAGVITWVVVSTTLADQKITVADDASCAAGDDVNGPFSAYCQADIIDQHTLDITGGKTYAELDREDPNRAVAMDSAFLQASLFTSVVAFGVAGMAFVLGIVLTLIGFALRAPAPRDTTTAA